MNSVELLHKCDQSESLKNEIYDLIFEEVKEYCKLTNNIYPKKEETCRIYIIDSYLDLLYNFDEEYYELEIPLKWFTNKESMLEDFKKEKISRKTTRINYLKSNINSCLNTIINYKSEITKLEKELNNE